MSPTDAVWKEIADYRQPEPKKVPVTVRRALARDPIVVAAKSGDGNAVILAGQLVDDAEAEELERAEWDGTGTRTRSRRKSRAFAPSKFPEFTYRDLMTGLITRHAQREEVAFTRAARSVLGLVIQKHLLPENINQKEYYERKRRIAITYGVRGSDLLRAIERLAGKDDARNPPAQFRKAATELTFLVDSYLAEQELPVPVQAFALTRAERRKATPGVPLGILNAPDEDGVYHAVEYYRVGGYLHALHDAARFLAAKYHWTVDGAVGFLLGDAWPHCHVARVEYDVRQPLSGLSRITLTLDPTLTPDQVAQLYADARANVLGNHKALSPKALSIGSHCFTQTHWPTESLEDFEALMRTWLEEEESYRGFRDRPPYTCAKASDFRKLAERARDHTLNPPASIPSEPVSYPDLRPITGMRKGTKPPKTPRSEGEIDTGRRPAEQVQKASKPPN